MITKDKNIMYKRERTSCNYKTEKDICTKKSIKQQQKSKEHYVQKIKNIMHKDKRSMYTISTLNQEAHSKTAFSGIRVTIIRV